LCGEVGLTKVGSIIVSFWFAGKETVVVGASSRVSRVLMTGPVAPFADEYVRELRRRGYTR